MQTWASGGLRLSFATVSIRVSDSFLHVTFSNTCVICVSAWAIIQMLYVWRWCYSLGGESLTSRVADRQQIHQAFRTGFIFPDSERAGVSSPDWWSHVSFDRPSSNTLHTITHSHQPLCPAEGSMSPKQTAGWEIYSSLGRRIHHFLCFFTCNTNQMSGISTVTSWWMGCEDNKNFSFKCIIHIISLYIDLLFHFAINS